MRKTAVLAAAVQAILRHAKPRRIWLHGSRSAGEEKPTSDIDLAYDDPSRPDQAAIQAELDGLPTLLGIDVRNLADSDERFAERVRATGVVLFSATKRLRFEDATMNFENALVRFEEALGHRTPLYAAGFQSVYPDLVLKRFEFVFEMAWKALMRYFDHVGIACRDPRGAFRAAYAQGLVADEDVWLDMIEHRDLSDADVLPLETPQILARAEAYAAALKALLATLKEKLAEKDAGWFLALKNPFGEA